MGAEQETETGAPEGTPVAFPPPRDYRRTIIFFSLRYEPMRAR